MNEILYDISVILSVYNRADELALTLDSLCNQTIGRDRFEVIVCDDGSKEDILGVTKRYEDKFNLRYCYQPDRGFCAATVRNLGIRVSHAKLCMLLDNGILLASKALECHVKAHKHKKCAVTGYVYGFDDMDIYSDEVREVIDNNHIDRAIEILEEQKYYDCREVVYQELGDDLNNYPASWVLYWAGNMSADRNFLFEVGLCDESFDTWGGEDNDLALALYMNGAEFILDRGCASAHYPHTKIHNLIRDPELGKQELLDKQKYLYSKYPLDTLRKWYDIHELELNQWLVKNGVNGDLRKSSQKLGSLLNKT